MGVKAESLVDRWVDDLAIGGNGRTYELWKVRFRTFGMIHELRPPSHEGLDILSRRIERMAVLMGASPKEV